MSRFEQLVKKFCPNGVEYKKLSDIAIDIFRGAGITRDQVKEEGTPCVRYGEIYTTYSIYFDTCVSHTDESTVQSKKYFEHGDILFAITGENVEDIAKSTAYIGHEKCLAGGDIVVLKHNQNPKYLSYALSTTSAQAQKSKGKVKSKVVHSSVPAIKDIVIPVPPLEVQDEIVKVLDNFTELTLELTLELTAELTARRKQYEYYRDMLLDFGNHCGRYKQQWRTLSDLFIIKRGKVISKDFIKDNIGIYPVYSSQTENNGELGRISTYDFDGEYLTWTTDGANAGSVFYRNEKFNITNVCGILYNNSSDVITRFVYHILYVEAPKYVSKGMGNPKLMSNVMSRIKIPVPPIEEQVRIVNILDRFGKLCNDISEGLPVEIEARRKQYEYYRDKLLSFKEAI